MIRILYLGIVKEYYRQNTIFIFIVLLLAFGFFRINDHLAIIEGILSNKIFLAIVLGLWITYGVKVTLFTLRFLSQRRAEFLFHSRLFSRFEQLWSLLVLQFALVQLTFIYFLIILGAGIVAHKWSEVFIMIFVQFLVLLGGSLLYLHKINHPNSHQDAVKKARTYNIVTPQWLFYPQFLIHKEPVLLLISKGAAVSVILGVCFLFQTDDYDIRLISLGVLLAAFCQSVIWVNFQYYEQLYFGIYKNLGISRIAWGLRYLLPLGVLLLPETIVLFRNLPASIALTDGVILTAFMWFMSFALLNIQFFLLRKDEDGFQKLFFLGICLALLIMFKVPLSVFIALSLIVGLGLIQKYYYEVE